MRLLVSHATLFALTLLLPTPCAAEPTPAYESELTEYEQQMMSEREEREARIISAQRDNTVLIAWSIFGSGALIAMAIVFRPGPRRAMPVAVVEETKVIPTEDPSVAAVAERGPAVCCPSCGQENNPTLENAGETILCNSCLSPIIVPAQASVAEQETAVAKPPLLAEQVQLTAVYTPRPSRTIQMPLKLTLMIYWGIPMFVISMILIFAGVPDKFAMPIGSTVGAIVGYVWHARTN